jgi:hypothetical protein
MFKILSGKGNTNKDSTKIHLTPDRLAIIKGNKQQMVVRMQEKGTLDLK